MIMIRSSRLELRSFQHSDIQDVYTCMTPAVTRFMRWELPTWEEYNQFCEDRLAANEPHSLRLVIRWADTGECLGLASVEGLNEPVPEAGIWLRETVHGQGLGKEAVKALLEWAFKTYAKEAIVYPVAVENTASRRIAEGLRGKIIEMRTSPKYDSVVYRILRESFED